jgi:hypothetical protein
MGTVDKPVDKARGKNGDSQNGELSPICTDLTPVVSPHGFARSYAMLRDKQGYLRTYNYY